MREAGEALSLASLEAEDVLIPPSAATPVVDPEHHVSDTDNRRMILPWYHRRALHFDGGLELPP